MAYSELLINISQYPVFKIKLTREDKLILFSEVEATIIYLNTVMDGRVRGLGGNDFREIPVVKEGEYPMVLYPSPKRLYTSVGQPDFYIHINEAYTLHDKYGYYVGYGIWKY